MFGRTPLHMAAKTGNHLAVRMLMKKFPNMHNVKDDAGWTPLDVATHLERKEAAHVLSGAGQVPQVPQIGLQLHKDEGIASLKADASGGGWSTKVEEGSVLDKCDIDERFNITGGACRAASQSRGTGRAGVGLRRWTCSIARLRCALRWS